MEDISSKIQKTIDKDKNKNKKLKRIYTEQENVNINTIDFYIQNNIKFPLLHVSCEKDNKLYLSEGNHRLVTLKYYKYNGFVPVILFDWMENATYFTKETKKRKQNSKNT